MKNSEYTREDLLEIMNDYRIMIELNAKKYPTALLSDLYASLTYVLKESGALESEEK